MKKIFKYGLIETLKNFIKVRQAFRKYRLFHGETRYINPPADYQRVFHEDFSSQLDLNVWLRGQPWGDFHPDHLLWYYDLTGELSYTSNEGLVLELKNKSKNYVKSDLPEWRRSPSLPETFTIPTGVGLITTKESWQYGWFEAWIQLPYGQPYWPAFWLSGKESWPPEIDIMEAYSEIGPEYDGYWFLDRFGKISNLKIQPNLHYGSVEEGTKEMYGSYDVPVADATKRFVQYACHWEKDFIRIYYDGSLIFETTNKKVLKWFNRESNHMIIILNHGRLATSDGQVPIESKMIVSEISVYQK